MIGTFPCRGRWITLQLADAPTGPATLVLVELAGACPGDPDAETIRVTACATPQAAHARATARLTAGWAAHASGDRRAERRAAAAALQAPTWRPPAPAQDCAGADETALAAVAHAVACQPQPFCLFPNPTAWRRPARHQ